MVQSGFHQGKPCARCVTLEQQLQQKEHYIQELRSYQKMLTNQLQSFSGQPVDEQNKQLRKSLHDQELREIKIKKMLDQANQELRITEAKLHEQSLLNSKFSQQNMDLRRQILTLEQQILNHQSQENKLEHQLTQNQQPSQEIKFIQSLNQMVISCHPPDFFKGEQPSLKQTWKWLKTVLTEYMTLKQKSQSSSIEYSSLKKKNQFNYSSNEKL